MPSTRLSVGRPPARVASGVGARIRAARLGAGWTQAELAGDRFSKAYISALENSLVQPSMAALQYLADRLGTSPSALVVTEDRTWTRLEADVRLASADWQGAADAFEGLIARTSEPIARAELLRGLAEALCALDRGREAIAPAAEAVATFTRVGRTADAAHATYWLAAAHYGSDSLPEARSLMTGLLNDGHGGRDDDPDLHVRVLVSLASIDLRDGERERGLAYLAEARALAEGFDDLRRAGYAWALAAGYRELGDLEAALRYGQQALALYRAAAADRDVASIGNDVALTYLALGNLEQATRYADEAAAGLARLDDKRKMAHVIDTQARVMLARGDAAQAAELATVAAEYARETGNSKALVDALATRARARAVTGDKEGAVADFERAAGLAHAGGSHARRAEVLRAWAEVLAGEGLHREAYDLLQQALEPN